MKLLTKYLIVLSFPINLLFAESNCESSKKNLNAILISDDFYDYKNYLHYSLGNYTNKNNTLYNLTSKDEISISDFDSDLIFGEYLNLKNHKDKIKNTEVPPYIKEFYKKNNIKFDSDFSNIHPLDLDTFILVSQESFQNIKKEDDLYKFNDQFRYTLSQSFYSRIENIKFINYLFLNNSLDFSHPLFESILYKQNTKYSLLNKNTFLTKYNDLNLSFYNNENIFQVTTDGFAYAKNLDFIQYPISGKIWENKEGKFTNKINKINYPSFFGFSVIINTQEGHNFLCYLMKPEQRDLIINSFDIGISPLSLKDINIDKKVSSKYKELLEEKSIFIKSLNTNNQDILNKSLHKKILNFIVKKDLSIFYDLNYNFF